MDELLEKVLRTFLFGGTFFLGGYLRGGTVRDGLWCLFLVLIVVCLLTSDQHDRTSDLLGPLQAYV